MYIRSFGNSYLGCQTGRQDDCLDRLQTVPGGMQLAAIPYARAPPTPPVAATYLVAIIALRRAHPTPTSAISARRRRRLLWATA
jgi:hypothetical protein